MTREGVEDEARESGENYSLAPIPHSSFLIPHSAPSVFLFVTSKFGHMIIFL